MNSNVEGAGRPILSGIILLVACKADKNGGGVGGGGGGKHAKSANAVFKTSQKTY